GPQNVVLRRRRLLSIHPSVFARPHSLVARRSRRAAPPTGSPATLSITLQWIARPGGLRLPMAKDRFWPRLSGCPQFVFFIWLLTRIAPRQICRRIGARFISVAHQRQQIFTRAHAIQSTCLDQTLQDRSHRRPMFVFVEERVLPQQHRALQRPLGEVVVERDSSDRQKSNHHKLPQ